ncbi:MAG TPA: carboxylate-amine ligase, partial [Saprospiraceae bacterium]|nr:carboxylate-amine ligase [Saprospiraceae bacterium]
MSDQIPFPWQEWEYEAFNRLQAQLLEQYEYAFPNPLAPKTVVVVPSMTLDADILAKIKGVIHYEERMLCILMLLRMPRTRIVFVSSMPIDEVIIDYYLHLLPGVTGLHARKRLVMLSCYDASNRPLTHKILEKPRLIEQIRQAIPGGHVAHLVGFNITEWEELLSLRLGIPLYGCPSKLNYWGSKSGSRELFRQAGLLIPPGFEHLSHMDDVVLALRELRRQAPGIRKAVVKLNDGFSGDGNAVFPFEQAGEINEDSLRRHLKIVASDLDYDQFAAKMALMGGIAEAFIDGEFKTSPSVQCRITPKRELEVISTHDQLLGGESGQVFIGATFPAMPDYARDLGLLGKQLCDVMCP